MKLDPDTIRDRLSGENGKQYWRSLEEIADTEEFREFLHREFPREAESWGDNYSRRDFMKIMGASLALAGLSSCVKQPDEKIVPYVKSPEIMVPGRPLYFATASVRGGYANGVIVTSHMGRPTKIEGNPDHPASLGATDIFMQASILSLYDPDRSQVITNKGSISTWSKFYDELQIALEIQKSLKGEGLRILTGTVTSPTLGNQLRSLQAMYPKAVWHQYEPVSQDGAREGAMMAFGEYVQTQYRLEKADVVLSLDSDLLAGDVANVRYARDFANRRRVAGKNGDMNRLYVVESMPTITGGMADHRLRARASDVEKITRAVAAQLGIPGVDMPDLSAREMKWISATVRDLRNHAGASVVIPGAQQPPVVHALAHLINSGLRNFGTTVIYTEPVEVSPVNQMESLRSLVNDMAAGRVDVLVTLGSNPVYAVPADLNFAEALEKVKLSIQLGLYNDETAARSSWHIPESHYLESWSDARAYDGTVTIQQPLIAPLYNSKSVHELLDEVLGRASRKAFDVVQDYWKGRVGALSFESFWKRSLNDGVVGGTALPEKQVAAKTTAAGWQFALEPDPGLEINIRPDPTIWDGQFSNNGWLQELPKPVTKITWDNAAFLSPATAKNLGLQNNEVVELHYQGRSVKAPVWIVPGHADNAVTLHLGYGRSRAGKVGSAIGANANLLRSSKSPWFGTGLKIEKTGERYKLAITQDHHSMEGREIVRAANVSEFEKKPTFAKELGHTPKPEESLYPAHKYEGYAWGMTIDLNACTGCNACVIACQSENNIPIVGKEQVENGREMHWIRVDRYFKGDLDEPEIYSQPVPCMHCENAPCEVVCPVQATNHDSEGLNVMVYNRCVGTRYCSNNCPYKVRRFNFLQFSDTKTETLQMLHNPDVTVRNRGVMEKCTYCVQRISAARIKSKEEGREIEDGEVVTACQSACPAQAIVFGNINDAESKVSKLKADPREYGLLAELNTKPRTSYLARLRNPNSEIEK